MYTTAIICAIMSIVMGGLAFFESTWGKQLPLIIFCAFFVILTAVCLVIANLPDKKMDDAPHEE